jgi:surfeit locus 1 family protein
MTDAHRTPDHGGGGAWRRPRFVGALALTLVGAAVLLGLMTWQVQRLAWKETLIARLEAALAEPPRPLPAQPSQDAHEFRRFTVSGVFTGETGAHGFRDAAYLTSRKPWGPGYRVVQPFQTEAGPLILVDRGYVPLAEKNVAAAAARPTPTPEDPLTLTGALRWPQESDWFASPEAGLSDNVWLTRSLDHLAPLWDADAVLLVAETDTAVGDWPKPQPVTVDLPNDHLEYAATWGGLAAIWLIMGAVLARREFRR